jgi:alpha-tubulin suppressor-like RCC1 family protein
VGKPVVGVTASSHQTAVWTEDGELFTFGSGGSGQLGHGGEEHELVPRLVEALAGKKVVGASASTRHMAVGLDRFRETLHIWERKL